MYHKLRGDEVQLYAHWNHDAYDKIYCSKIFTYTKAPYLDRKKMIIGGTGFDTSVKLPPEIDACLPDYTIYNWPYNMGFLSRGCRFKCSFCVVPTIEGRTHTTGTVSKMLTNPLSNYLVLMDSDIFGNPTWRQEADEIIDRKLKIAIPNGFNIRIITEEQSIALKKFRTYTSHFKSRSMYFAWDRPSDEKVVMKGLDLMRRTNYPFYRLHAFVLIGNGSTYEEDLHRANILHYNYKIRVCIMLFGYVTPYMRELKTHCRMRWSHRPKIYGVSDYYKLNELYKEHVDYKAANPDGVF